MSCKELTHKHATKISDDSVPDNARHLYEQIRRRCKEPYVSEETDAEDAYPKMHFGEVSCVCGYYIHIRTVAMPGLGGEWDTFSPLDMLLPHFLRSSLLILFRW